MKQRMYGKLMVMSNFIKDISSFLFMFVPVNLMNGNNANK